MHLRAAGRRHEVSDPVEVDRAVIVSGRGPADELVPDDGDGAPGLVVVEELRRVGLTAGQLLEVEAEAPPR
jgi:hypothetical protein